MDINTLQYVVGEVKADAPATMRFFGSVTEEEYIKCIPYGFNLLPPLHQSTAKSQSYSPALLLFINPHRISN